MKYYNLIFFIAFSFSALWGQKIAYQVAMPQPETHYFHVKTELTDFKDKKLTLVMPVWSPGSYLIREYPNNVNLVTAKNERGEVLAVRKVSKNKWEIDKKNARKVTVEYQSYAFDLTVRTAFLDETHGFFNGTNIFTYPEGYEKLGGTVEVIPASNFTTISCPLEKVKDGFSRDDRGKIFKYTDFEELADTPFEVGNQEVFEFEAAGVSHKVAMYGEGNYDVEKLKVDLAKVVEAATSIFGQNPNKDYLFIVHNTDQGGGGLEHKNSTTLKVNRWTYDEEGYRNFLSLVAHEYFHVWNVKRLRPSVLVNYDYSNENYTDLLWVMEGFTSYYSEIILRRAGFYTREGYIHKLQSVLNYVEGTPGNKVQPVSHASYDAWIKAYRTNENSYNTTTSYYSKGGLIGSLFDAMIIAKYKGKKDLADFMQLLYEKYYEKKNIGFTQDTFRKELSDYLGKDMTDFFKKYIDSTETLPYKEIYGEVGLEVELSLQAVKTFGISLGSEDGKTIINRVNSGSVAEKAGLSVNDEIIAIQNYRIHSTNDISKWLGRFEIGDSFTVLIARDDTLMEKEITLEMTESQKYYLKLTDHQLNDFWLRTMD